MILGKLRLIKYVRLTCTVFGKLSLPSSVVSEQQKLGSWQAHQLFCVIQWTWFKLLFACWINHFHHHHHHISIMELGHLLTCFGLTYPEVSSKVCHDSFCQLQNIVSLPWVIYYETFYLHVVSSFSCTPAICPKLVLFFNSFVIWVFVF